MMNQRNQCRYLVALRASVLPGNFYRHIEKGRGRFENAW